MTPAQDRLHFASFDVITESREELIDLLRQWTEAAARMTAGQGAGPVGPVAGDYDVPPDDTGEAIGLHQAGLTITFGFGPTLFVDAAGQDRFGLAARRPAALVPLPRFAGDLPGTERSGGDLCVQACADDPQVAVHAIRNLARIGFGVVSVRWSQLGFGRTSSTSTTQATPRNLFGFKDGTMNVKAEEPEALDEFVWVADGDDPNGDWLAGGSYLVTRRIAMTVEVWDRQPLGDQELFIGRTKAEGAPLSGGTEFDQPDFEMMGRARPGDAASGSGPATGPGRGSPVVPVDSHVAVVHPDHNGGMRMLRRGYNFVDGSNDIGGLDAGLFFVAFVRDPRTQFIPVQHKMAKLDTLMEYLRFTGSALFAVPPGIGAQEYVGQALFE
ncbi:MAG: Dyp-type peroxidase [Nocardioides sp.]